MRWKLWFLFCLLFDRIQKALTLSSIRKAWILKKKRNIKAHWSYDIFPLTRCQESILEKTLTAMIFLFWKKKSVVPLLDLQWGTCHLNSVYATGLRILPLTHHTSLSLLFCTDALISASLSSDASWEFKLTLVFRCISWDNLSLTTTEIFSPGNKTLKIVAACHGECRTWGWADGTRNAQV